MATALDAVFTDLAANLLLQFGAAAVLRVAAAAPAYDPESGQVTEFAPTEVAVRCVPPYEYRISPHGSGTGGIPGCPQGVAVTLVSTKLLGTVKPKKRDTVEFSDGRSFMVVDVFPLVSGDLVAAYALQVEGSGVTP